MKKTMKGPHWGDDRAKLEVDIQEILSCLIQINNTAANEDQLKKIRDKEAESDDDDNVFVELKAKQQLKQTKQQRYRSSSSSSSIQQTLTSSSKSDELKSLNIELITLVRKKFAVTLQKLIQHGLRNVNENKHLVPFMGCFSTFQISNEQYEDCVDMHAWELITEYYNLKNGDLVTETPAQKLSQSFNLEIFNEGITSNKQVSVGVFIMMKIECQED